MQILFLLTKYFCFNAMLNKKEQINTLYSRYSNKDSSSLAKETSLKYGNRVESRQEEKLCYV